jgi:hypothetical protein
LYLQENLKHTLPSDGYDFEADSSVDLRIGYQAQQLDWLSLQRITQEALLPPDTEDRPATLSSLPVSQTKAIIFSIGFHRRKEGSKFVSLIIARAEAIA